MARQKRIDPQVCILLYRMGYSLEDIAIIYKKEDGNPTSPSVISKVIKKERETRGIEVAKGIAVIEPRQMNQEFITYLSNSGLFTDITALYESKYRRNSVKSTKFKKSLKEFTPREKQVFELGRKLYVLEQRGHTLKAIKEQTKLPDHVVKISMNLFKSYIA